MKKMLAIAAMPLMILAGTSTPPGFTDNLDEAFELVKGNGKYIYACFSGSDWCGWCKRLEREVLSRAEFLDGVTNSYVLVYIDSPSDVGLLSERARTENPRIVERYRISGFPTALIFDENGGIVAKTGYREGGAAAYAAFLTDIRTRGPALRRETELTSKYIKPFTDRMTAIMDEMVASFDRFVADECARGVAEEAAIDRSCILLPPYVSRVETLIEAFRASELPLELAQAKSNELLRATTFLASLREEAAKAALYEPAPAPAPAPEPTPAPAPAPAPATIPESTPAPTPAPAQVM